MERMFVNVDNDIIGLRIAETIFNEYGAVIISENAVLNENAVKKLRGLGITKIRIYFHGNKANEIDHREIAKVQYEENISLVKEVLHEISTGKNLSIDKVNKVSDSILEGSSDKWEIISCMNDMRSIDEYTYSHSINVSMLCMLFAGWLNYDSRTKKLLVQAGLLHDIGKSRVPHEILDKKGKLTEEEFEQVKKHTVYGYKMAETIPGIDKEVLNGILMHHEREDGSGYPLGITGDDISLFAKIIAVADTYDAMTSERVYRRRESPFSVFDLIENKSYGIFDTNIRTVFLNNIANYYIGERVKLNNGEIAEIIYINQRYISQPVIKIGKEYVDLSLKKDIKILELV